MTTQPSPTGPRPEAQSGPTSNPWDMRGDIEDIKERLGQVEARLETLEQKIDRILEVLSA